MKAVVKTERKRGATFMDVPAPKITHDDEILVKVKAAAICGTDLHIYQWNKWASEHINTPQIIGHEFAGEVVEVGKEVKRVKVGDYISAETHISCGHCYQCLSGHPEVCENLKILGVSRDGAFAEYIVIPEKIAWKNPSDMPVELAAIQEPMGNAVDTVLAEDVAGKTVAITGVGPIGLLAVGVARASGATKIIVSDLSDYHLDIAKKMGADVTVNVASANFKEVVMDETDGRGVDVGLEMSGNAHALNDLLDVMTPAGRVSLLGLFSDDFVPVKLNDNVIFKKLRIYGITGRRIFQTWIIVSRFLNSNRVDFSPVITHKFQLKDFERGMLLMEQKKSGKVILYP
jgi:threonine 3-dehydrogenase